MERVTSLWHAWALCRSIMHKLSLLFMLHFSSLTHLGRPSTQRAMYIHWVYQKAQLWQCSHDHELHGMNAVIKQWNYMYIINMWHHKHTNMMGRSQVITHVCLQLHHCSQLGGHARASIDRFVVHLSSYTYTLFMHRPSSTAAHTHAHIEL